MYKSSGEQEITVFRVSRNENKERYRNTFTVPSGVISCNLRIECDGLCNIRKIYIREGRGVSEYLSNPNEIYGSDVCITQDEVSISTSDFTLNIIKPDGGVTTVLSADGAGFDDVICSNLTINDRKYLGTGNRHIYVNSGAGSDSNSGESTYYPFKTIGRALKAIPAHITDKVTLHLSGGEYYEDMNFNYGGSGILEISGESATLYGHIFVNSSGYAISINNMKIYSRSQYGFYGYGGSAFVYMNKCIVDCNGMVGSYGIYVGGGFDMYIKEVEVNNCNYALFCTQAAHLTIWQCVGDENECGVIVDDMGLINCEGTVPLGNIISKEETGGRIEGLLIGGKVGSNYLVPRDSVLKISFSPSASFSYNGTAMVSGVLKQGNGWGTFFVFNIADISAKLTGKVIKSVKIIIKRRSDDGLTHDGILRVYTHNLSLLTDSFSYVDSFGDVGTIKRGEQVSVELAPAVIANMLAGKIKGILFYHSGSQKTYTFELDQSFSSRLEVLYV